MNTTIETERLLLRCFRNDEFEQFFAMASDPDATRYIGGPLDREGAHRSFCAMLGHWVHRGFGFFAVVEKASGSIVGRAGLNAWEAYPGVEVGYGFLPAAWGKGYATEAAARCLKYAHETVGARGVISLIDPANLASQKVVAKLGARNDRSITYRGKPVDVWVHRDPK